MAPKKEPSPTPTNLSGSYSSSVSGASTVALSWTDPSEVVTWYGTVANGGVLGYDHSYTYFNIQRSVVSGSTSGAFADLVNDLAPHTTTYTDSTVVGGSGYIYSYRVSTSSAKQDPSDWSNVYAVKAT